MCHRALKRGIKTARRNLKAGGVYLNYYSAMIIHIPHASTMLPDDIREQFVLDDAQLTEELRVMTDWYTDELFGEAAGAADCVIQYPVSRLVVDPERFVEDQDETMSQVGMGVVYTSTSDGRPLRRPLAGAERDDLIQRFHSPYHKALEQAVEKELRQTGEALIVDGHSFPRKPLPYEPDQNPDRPDVCIGSDPFHTSVDLRDALCARFKACGYRVAVNRPFAGALVPTEFFGKNANVQSVMIEINRSLYMDEQTLEKKSCFADLQKILKEIMSGLKRN